MAKKKWETLLNEATAMIQQSRENLFDAVTNLVAVMADEDFLSYHGGVLDKAEAMLDALLVGYDLSYQEAALMLKYFPAREQWRTKGIRELLNESIDRRDAESKANKPERSKPRRVSLEEFAKLQEQIEAECKTTARLSQKLAESETERKSLEQKIRDLTRELARAEGRIVELERMVNRSLSIV